MRLAKVLFFCITLSASGTALAGDLGGQQKANRCQAPTVQFDLDSARISPPMQTALEAFANCVLEANADYKSIRIEGHVSPRLADETERSETRALALSDRLARRVKTALEKAGLNPKKLKTYGFGAVRPACTEKTKACNAANQRVELVFESN